MHINTKTIGPEVGKQLILYQTYELYKEIEEGHLTLWYSLLRGCLKFCYVTCILLFRNLNLKHLTGFPETFAQYGSMYFRYTDMMKSLFTKQLDVTNMNLFWQVSYYRA